MTPFERNHYLDTMRPILFLMKISGIIPTFEAKVKSTIIAITGITLFTSNLIYTITAIVGYISQHSLDGKIFVAVIPALLVRSIQLLIPLAMWTNLHRVRNFWNKWKYFQDEYENLSKRELVPNLKNKMRFATGECIGFIIISHWIAEHNVPYGNNYLWRASDVLNLSVVCFMGVYWLSNCSYFKTIGKEINLCAKKCTEQGQCKQQLRKFMKLWLCLSDLMEEFIRIHFLFFFLFFTEVVAALIIMTYICLYYTFFSKLFPEWVALHSLLMALALIFTICESAYHVYKQVHLKHVQMLLERNTWKMNTAILQSMSRFLDTIFIRNPSITLYGTAINRNYFTQIIAIIINYIIIMRQFQY